MWRTKQQREKNEDRMKDNFSRRRENGIWKVTVRESPVYMGGLLALQGSEHPRWSSCAGKRGPYGKVWAGFSTSGTEGASGWWKWNKMES